MPPTVGRSTVLINHSIVVVLWCIYNIVHVCNQTQDIYLHNPDVRWDDIIGLDAAKRLVKEAVVYPIKVGRSVCTFCKCYYYMAGSVSGQNEVNAVF